MQENISVEYKTIKQTIISPLLTFMSIAFLGGSGFGISLSLVSLILEDRNISSEVIGWTIAITTVGVMTGLPLVPRLMRKPGAKKSIYTMSLAGVIVISFYSLIDGPLLAFFLRIISGFIFGILWVFIENLLLRIAPKDKKANWVTLYAVAFLFGVGAGPTLMSMISSAGIDWAAFGFANIPSGYVNPSHAVAMIMLLALEITRHIITVRLLKNSPNMPPPITVSLRKLFSICKLIPVALIAAVICGAIEIGMVSLGPVYLLRQSISASDALIFTASFFFGGALFLLVIQMFWKGGNEKRILVLTLILMTIGIMVLKSTIDLWHTDAWYRFAPILLFCIFGASTYLLFCISLLMIIPVLSDSDLIFGNSAIVLLQTFAGSIFPPFAGYMMDGSPHWGLPVSMLIVTVTSLFLIIPILKRSVSTT